MERLTGGLWWRPDPHGATVLAGDDAGAVPVLGLACAEGRVRVALGFLDGRRRVDVSAHPAAAVGVLHSRARRLGYPPDGWAGALRSRLVDAAPGWQCWVPRSPVPDLVGVLGGLAHPLLGGFLDAGGVAVDQVPRWLSPALASPTPRDAARLLLGSAATRSVTRSLARVLLATGPDGGPVWWPPGLAAAAHPVLDPDRLARVLDARPGRADLPPTGRELDVVRRGLSLLEPDRAGALVLDALAHEAGSRSLVAVLGMLIEAHPQLDWPPPARVDTLRAACLAATPLDPLPAPPPADHRRPPDPPEPPPRRHGPHWAVPRYPPEVGPVERPEHFAYEPAVAHLHGTRLGDLRLELPRTPAELDTWGRLLANCLADYAAAVAAGRSVVVGIRDRDLLVAAAEIRPAQRRLNQLLAARNRPPAARITEPVLAHLRATGLVRPG